MLMRSADPTIYDFIPSDNSLSKNNGFCVVDIITEIYSPLLKRLSRESFIESVCWIEHGLDGDVDEAIEKYKIEDGVRASTLNKILKDNDISYISIDIMNNCWDKYRSKNNNYPILVYYSVNNHMYYVNNEHIARKISHKYREKDIRANSDMFQNFIVEDNAYVNENNEIKPIYSDIPIEDLLNEIYDNSIIVYTETTHLENVLIKIISVFNYIPMKIKHTKQNITKMIFALNGRNIIITVDEMNISHPEYSYNDIINMCKSHVIPYCDQTIGSLIKEIRNHFF